ncbi:PD-(D/E)XK nuclease family protein [Neobacillus sp. YIM B02564]|uniref:PD-(D/E)XK nuclease family protein n=1 Tax=Neobacillus paridis TaxID=2803862 RepID=A0ABS1TIC0_9BACI|nr:PD-(D/E)XK nuclease family protein [Neobacillus paridis]MBL4951069.1 PD-(D/E)XK nuclease family protein [Neobacillus paridis]
MSEQKYSFSRLETFHNCKRNFYYTYILDNRSGESIYTYLGTVCHELTEAIIQKQMTNDDAVIQFIEAVDDAEMLDLRWISDNVKNNYVNCIVHFFENFSPIDNPTIRIEDYFEIDINGVTIIGYIDLWYMIGNDIYIIDLKTSSKFSKKDLPKKSRQLLLYAIALSEKYPDYKIHLQFNMLKYVLKNGKLFERNKLNLFDEFPDGIVEVDFNEESIQDVKDYVINTVKEINSIDKSDIVYWNMGYDPTKDFFCKNLCGHRSKCLERLGKVVD